MGPSPTNGRSGGRLAGDCRWAASGDYGDRNGSDGGGAGGAGEARGQAAGTGRGRWARAADSGLSPQEEEFRWLLHDEVHAVLRQLQDILKVTRRGWPRAFACARLPQPPLARLLAPGRPRLPPERPLRPRTRDVQTGPCLQWTCPVGGTSR